MSPRNALWLQVFAVLGTLGLITGGVQLILLAPALGTVRLENLFVLALLAASIGQKRLGRFRLGALVPLLSLYYGGLGAGALSSALISLTHYLDRPFRERRLRFVAMAFPTVLGGTVGGLVAGVGLTEVPHPLDLRCFGGALVAAAVMGVAMAQLEPKPESTVVVGEGQWLLGVLAEYLIGALVASGILFAFRSDTGLQAALVLAPAVYLSFITYDVHRQRQRDQKEHTQELQTSQSQLADLYLSTIKSLALAIDAKDAYTHQHILRVQRYSVAVGEKMGLSGNEMEGLKTGALLHDIGKLGVPEYVLLKPGRLTADEFEKIKKHPEIGAAILDPVEFPWPVLPVVKYHHEKWNGTGYPEGLKGENIPLTARILAVADVYDALTSTRSYRNAWPHERALKLIREESGTHFDPVVAEAFLAVINHVVEEMAREGTGPLAPRSDNQHFVSKADEAARDIHRASSELWALYEVAQTLSASIGTEETLDILVRKLEAILPGTACLFLMPRTEAVDQLEVRAAVGVNSELFLKATTSGPRSLTLKVAKSRESYLGEYDYDDLMVGGSTTTPWRPLNAALIVPIVHQGTTIGTINIYHQQPAAFQTHDLQLIETIADRIALALYNGHLYDRTRNSAFNDPLTDLYNLRFFTQFLERRCGDEASKGPFSLLCLDLDNFKPVNDVFGHQRGDQVLRDLAGLLKASIGPRDLIARYSGDEFLIFLEGTPASQAEAFARGLVEKIAAFNPNLYHLDLGEVRLGASVGVASFPEAGSDCNTLLSLADQRMYQNKNRRKLQAHARPTPRRKAA